ncbi:MAG: protein kinase [Acidobacteria bacterium]|nr:protein kinase [Acidobacteriota bacterium]
MIGTTISHYRITKKLGEGGMGVVYKADDTKLDRPVALKLPAAHLISDQEVRKRFEREAKAAAALHHPNICTVHEIDEFEGKTFIAMAFLEGAPLDNYYVRFDSGQETPEAVPFVNTAHDGTFSRPLPRWPLPGV